ncbi:sulfotransferase family protein [Actibacterium sp. XHP0104]|uniref:sulfotransferase family protein n=1 Tax=Actibacterium sp. XHP0104 TaxID=2984335 RepID=UPI0021E8F0EF|nr:sulfotransferase [Actibacterium sp. XHP0104]MCV2881870.1 sulfotransferase domain-containing protein [Actibacterium sp. XHP0104]
MALPDFIIIGAMKCGTSTLAAQIGAQPGLFMTDPKEPNFFSDDDVYARGMGWYQALFDAAAPGDIRGEASTHYTKLPTYPQTLPRMQAALGTPKLVYMMRNPVTRAESHYIHEWTMGVITTDIDTAIDTHPELISYGCYARQIAPFIDAYGAENLFVTSLEAMKSDPQATLEQVCAFLGHTGAVQWQEEQAQMNASAERIRRFPLHGLLIDNPVAAGLRRALVPQGLRDRIKKSRQMQQRPQLSPASLARLHAAFAEDRTRLHDLLPGRADLDRCYPFLTDG